MNRTALDEWSQDTAGLRRLAVALARDAFAADDLVQETWLLGLRRGIAAPTRWFRGVLRFKAREARRAEDRRRRREGAAARPESVASDPLEHIARLEACRRAVELLQQLPEPYRETLSLHFLAGRALAQIARDHGIPSATVRTRLSRGLEQLRERMDADEGGRRRWSMLLMPFAVGGPGVGLATGAAVVLVAGLALGLAFVGTGSDAPRGLDVGSGDGIGDGSLAEPVARSGSAGHDSPTLGGFVAGDSRRARGAAGDVVPAGPPTWVGRLVLPEGVGIGGMSVYAVRKDGTRGPQGEPASIATLADGGSFTLPLAEPEKHWILSTPAYEPGLRRAWIDGATLRVGEPFTLEPLPAPRLHVTVVGADGRPVEGARFNLRGADANEVLWPGPSEPAGGSVRAGVGPDGIDLPLIYDTPIRLAITASGSGTWVRVLDPVEQHVRAVLEPTAAVNVRVTGDLVPGDEISASLHSLPPPAANATFVAGGQARAEGPRVTINLGDHIGPGAYVIEVSSPRHRSTRVAGVVVRFPGEVVEVEARLEALRDLGSMRLTFRENGAVLAELPVDAGPMLLLERAGDPTGTWRFAWASRSHAGSVVLSNLAAGTYDLLCSLRKPARAALVRGVVVRADESSAVVAVVEPALWARVPSGAEAAPDAEILARDGQPLPRFFDEGGRMQVDEPGTASSPERRLGPFPLSAGPLRWRSTESGRPREVDLPAAPR